MQLRTVVAALLASSIAAAQPAPPEPPPPEDQAPPPPAPEPAPPPAAPEPAPALPPPPPSNLPPITINITNNNNGNNSNTNTQTNTQTNTAPVTVSTPVNVTTPVTTTVTNVPPPPSLPPIPSTPPMIIERFATPRREAGRWIAIGVLGGHHEHGVRASIDLLRRGPFTLGVAATAMHDGEPGDHHRADAGGRCERDGKFGAAAYLAFTRPIGRLEIRASVGLGFGGRHDDHGDEPEPLARGTTPTGEDGDHHRGKPRAEASLLVGVPLGKHLGLVAGPVVAKTRDEEPMRAMMFGLRWAR